MKILLLIGVIGLIAAYMYQAYLFMLILVALALFQMVCKWYWAKHWPHPPKPPLPG